MDINSYDIITIDGESASGKSSVADSIALRMGYTHLDGGIIFRTMGFLMDFHNLDLNGLATSLDRYSVMNDVKFEGTVVKYKGMDITHQIQSEGAGLRAASLGKYEHFQNWFIEFLKEIVQTTKSSCVVSGRIGGSVIFPFAKHKFYLQADLHIKAKRRYEQLVCSSQSSLQYEEVVKSINSRDDLQNIIHYWKINVRKDTMYIDTSKMTISDVITAMEFRIKNGIL